MTVLEAIQKSADFLGKKNVESPRLQTELLLAHLLKLPRMKLYLNFERVLTPAETDALRELVKRRGQREPLQHIVGTTSFCGFEIAVNRHALVPRPETELLAEAGWQFLLAAPKQSEGGSTLNPQPSTALDFGTGTGCIAIALAAKCPDAKITALDISADALALAKENAARNKVAERIEFVQGNGFAALQIVGQASSLSGSTANMTGKMPIPPSDKTGETPVPQQVGQASSLSGSAANMTGKMPVPLSDVPLPFNPFDRFRPAGIESRHLPHWTQEGATYFVTFRLADSLPKEVYVRWKIDCETALRSADQSSEAIAEHFREEMEKRLDDAHGACWLKNPDLAEMVEKTLRHFDGERYVLGSYAIMPNHVHVIVRPLMDHKLSEILHSWKSFSAKEANQILRRTGEFWQDESFDHIVRDEQSLEKFGNYIRKNPARAGLKTGFRIGVGQASSLSSSTTNMTGETPIPQQVGQASSLSSSAADMTGKMLIPPQVGQASSLSNSTTNMTGETPVPLQIGQASSISETKNEKSETGKMPVPQFDLIISNPPYIASAEIATLQPEVRDFDPRTALDGGADGLDFYRMFATQAKPFLKPDGKIMLEFGDGQADAIKAIFENEKWIVEAVKEDYSQRARIIIAKL